MIVLNKLKMAFLSDENLFISLFLGKKKVTLILKGISSNLKRKKVHRNEKCFTKKCSYPKHSFFILLQQYKKHINKMKENINHL